MICSGLAAPLSSFAQQQAAKVHRIGFLGTAFASGYVSELDWVRAGLRNLGYVEGRNIVIEYRWGEGNSDVMADGADPVATGLAESLARPGRNVTGSTSFVFEEVGKRLQLLKEVAPRIKRVAFLASSLVPEVVFAPVRKTIHDAAAAMKVELQDFLVREAADLPDAFNAMSKARIDATVINSEPLLNSHTGTIAGLAAVKGLPAVGFASFADAGGLLAYGANRPALYGRAAYFLDRIFKGAKPGEIPFERATKFDLIVNLKTAKALGIKVPQAVLIRANRVIE